MKSCVFIKYCTTKNLNINVNYYSNFLLGNQECFYPSVNVVMYGKFQQMRERTEEMSPVAAQIAKLAMNIKGIHPDKPKDPTSTDKSASDTAESEKIDHLVYP